MAKGKKKEPIVDEVVNQVFEKVNNNTSETTPKEDSNISEPKNEQTEEKSDIIDAVSVIEEFNEAAKKLDETINSQSTPEEIRQKLESELERTDEIEKKLEKQVEKLEKTTNAATYQKFSNFWNGVSNGWFS